MIAIPDGGRSQEARGPAVTQETQTRAAAEHERTSSTPDNSGRATAQWLPAELERLRVTRIVQRPLRQVEESLRVRPEKLIQLAYGYLPGLSATTISLAPFETMNWLRIPVLVESWTPPADHLGPVICIRWQASRFTPYFPVMEADLEVRPHGSDATEFVLEGKYRPPLGLIGLVCDRLFARWVATATARSFVDRLATSMETDA